MNINIISIGKFKNNPQKEIFLDYIKRTSSWKIILTELEVKNFSSSEDLTQKEGELLLKSCSNSSKIILLDERGKDITSRKLAELISDYGTKGDSNLSFIIGGASGVSEEVKKKSDISISLSKLTFPHMMVRSILAEQLYRAYSILNNHPYHRD